MTYGKTNGKENETRYPRRWKIRRSIVWKGSRSAVLSPMAYMNVVYILADQHNPSFSGCFGGVTRKPYLDACCTTPWPRRGQWAGHGWDMPLCSSTWTPTRRRCTTWPLHPGRWSVVRWRSFAAFSEGYAIPRKPTRRLGPIKNDDLMNWLKHR